jgi:hypothetical protein
MREEIAIVLQLLTLLGMIFAVYKYFRTPSDIAKEEIALIKQACVMRHRDIDENIVMIKENHLRHIEADIVEIKITLAGISAVLSERNERSR